MSTMAVLGRDFGERINDSALANTPFWKFLVFANKAIRDLVARTDCLSERKTVTGAYKITIALYSALAGNTITVVVDGVTSTALIAAAASNSAMATAIAVQLAAVTGLSAYSSGAYVYVLGVDGAAIDSLTCDNSGNATIATLSTTASTITFVDYSLLTGDTITLKTSLDASATTYTIAAALSNAAMATAVEVQLEAHANIGATVVGSLVYIAASGGATIETFTINEAASLVIEDGVDSIALGSVLTRIRNVRNIYDDTNDILYKSLSSQLWDRMLIDADFTGYVWYVDPANNLYVKVDGVNADSANTFIIEYWQWPAALTLHSESAPGILSDWDEAIINRALYYFYMTQAKLDFANVCAGQFERDVRAIREQLRQHGEPQEQRLFYQWH